MRLLVEKITDIGRDYTLTLAAADLNCLLGQAPGDFGGLFAGDVRIDYRLSRVGRRLLLDGGLSADLSLQCGRCLNAHTGELKESFSVALSIVDQEDSFVEELELDDEQINSISLVDGEVDLLPVLMEQLLLSLPTHSLCREDCAGLCPYCGTDLNTAKCDCEPRHFNNRFGKLKDLKLDPS